MSDTETCTFCGGIHLDEPSRSFNETPNTLHGIPVKVCPNVPYDLWVAIGRIDSDMIVTEITDDQPG